MTQEFYFPPPKPRVIFTRDQKPVRTDEARIMLAEIPFVRLRDGVPKDLPRGKASFGEVVEANQRNLAPTQVILNTDRCSVRVGETEVRLEPRYFAFYAWLAERRRDGLPSLRGDGARTENFFRSISAFSAPPGATRSPWTKPRNATGDKPLEREFIHEAACRINAKLETVLGHLARHAHGIVAAGERGESEYSLAVPAERIGWEE